jgi:excisionase family DNA binding protein
MDKMLTPEEVAQLLGVKKSTIYSWTHEGFIPFSKVGRLLRFQKEDVLDWVNKRSMKGRKDRIPDVIQ